MIKPCFLLLAYFIVIPLIYFSPFTFILFYFKQQEETRLYLLSFLGTFLIPALDIFHCCFRASIAPIRLCSLWTDNDVTVDLAYVTSQQDL